MILSRCCRIDVFVLTDYYICSRCHRPCATLDVSEKRCVSNGRPDSRPIENFMQESIDL